MLGSVKRPSAVRIWSAINDNLVFVDLGINGEYIALVIRGPLKPTETLAPLIKLSLTPFHKLPFFPNIALSHRFVENAFIPSLIPSTPDSCAVYVPTPINCFVLFLKPY